MHVALQIKALTKKYNGRAVIDTFSYDFPTHGLFAVIGKSGEGKTTLLRLIASLEKPDAGEITGNEYVSVSFQEYRLFEHLSARENVTMVCFRDVKEGEMATRDLLLRLGLNDEEQGFAPRKLSGGMKQRVSLARAILSDAPVLLLDEPFKELDPALRAVVCELLHEQAEKRLVLFSAHAEEEARSIGAASVFLS